MIGLLTTTIDDAPHPSFTPDASWAGVMIILVLGLFFAAAAVGVVVRLNAHQSPEIEAH